MSARGLVCACGRDFDELEFESWRPDSKGDWDQHMGVDKGVQYFDVRAIPDPVISRVFSPK